VDISAIRFFFKKLADYCRNNSETKQNEEIDDMFFKRLTHFI
jgi:hypothetical protein